MKILVVDDHAVVRKGLNDILAEHLPQAEFGEAGTASEALEHVRKERWDLVVLDIELPGRSGIDVLRELKHMDHELPVLVLSMHPENQFAVRMLRAGAAGYVTKDRAPEELVQAVRKILAR